MSIRKRDVELDRYDIAILSALATNNRLTTVEIATIVHLSRTAVSRRISNLKKAGVLNDATDVLDYKSIGFGVRALIDIDASGQTATTLRERLLTQAEVLGVAVVAGDGLLCIDVIAVDMDHLHAFVASLQESGSTSTKIVFSRKQSELTLVERMRLVSEQTGIALV